MQIARLAPVNARLARVNGSQCRLAAVTVLVVTTPMRPLRQKLLEQRHWNHWNQRRLSQPQWSRCQLDATACALA